MHTRKNVVFVALAVTAVLLCSSCASTPVPMLRSTVPIGEKIKYESLGPSWGFAWTFSIFGLWMWDRPNIDEAFDQAIKLHGGDAMINVTCRERTYWLILTSITTVSVEGEVIKFKRMEKNDAAKKKK